MKLYVVGLKLHIKALFLCYVVVFLMLLLAVLALAQAGGGDKPVSASPRFMEKFITGETKNTKSS
jgi:hypothetical protein